MMNSSTREYVVQEKTKATSQQICRRFETSYCLLGPNCNRLHVKKITSSHNSEDRQPNESVQVYKSHGQPIAPPVIVKKRPPLPVTVKAKPQQFKPHVHARWKPQHVYRPSISQQHRSMLSAFASSSKATLDINSSTEDRQPNEGIQGLAPQRQSLPPLVVSRSTLPQRGSIMNKPYFPRPKRNGEGKFNHSRNVTQPSATDVTTSTSTLSPLSGPQKRKWKWKNKHHTQLHSMPSIKRSPLEPGELEYPMDDEHVQALDNPVHRDSYEPSANNLHGYSVMSSGPFSWTNYEQHAGSSSKTETSSSVVDVDQSASYSMHNGAPIYSSLSTIRPNLDVGTHATSLLHVVDQPTHFPSSNNTSMVIKEETTIITQTSSIYSNPNPEKPKQQPSQHYSTSLPFPSSSSTISSLPSARPSSPLFLTSRPSTPTSPHYTPNTKAMPLFIGSSNHLSSSLETTSVIPHVFDDSVEDKRQLPEAGKRPMRSEGSPANDIERDRSSPPDSALPFAAKIPYIVETVHKDEPYQEDPVLVRQLKTAGTRFYGNFPEGCDKHTEMRRIWAFSAAGTLERLGLQVHRILMRDDGMAIDWSSPVPVWDDTFLPETKPASVPTPPILPSDIHPFH